MGVFWPGFFGDGVHQQTCVGSSKDFSKQVQQVFGLFVLVVVISVVHAGHFASERLGSLVPLRCEPVVVLAVAALDNLRVALGGQFIPLNRHTCTGQLPQELNVLLLAVAVLVLVAHADVRALGDE